jgi:large subunit ribosomal protein L25
MDQATVTAELRTVLGKQVKRLRREGWVPGVVYGHGFDPLSLKFEERSLSKVLANVGGSQLVQVVIKDREQAETVLVREVQRDVITRHLVHVDLYRVMMTERLRAAVPLFLVGESPVIASGEGILLQGISSVEVECLPGELVDSIEVDLAAIERLDQALHVGDLPVPPGIDILTDPDEMVVRAVPLAAEEEEIVEGEELLVSAEVEVLTEAEEELGEA